MTTLTIPVIALVIAGLATRFGWGRALALSGVPAAGVAVTAGGVSVPSFYTAAVFVGTAAIYRTLMPAPTIGEALSPVSKAPGRQFLWAFLGWSILVTLIAPILFDGRLVEANGTVSRLTGGTITSSNIAQISYLLVGILVFTYLSQSDEARVELIGLVVGGSVLVSFWRYLHLKSGLPFPEGFFDNSPNSNYIETSADGDERFRGILSEPSGLALMCLVALGYLLPRSLRVQGSRRLGCLVLAGLAGYMGFISTSTTFVVAGTILAALGGGTFLIGLLLRRSALSIPLGVLTAVVAGVLVLTLPFLGGYVDSTVEAKTSTSSFSDRGATDARAYETFLDTFGLGTGLGSSRGSAFFPNLLSVVGLPGALLFFGALVVLLFNSKRSTHYQPVVWALVSLMVTKAVSGPDLSETSGVMWISLGILAYSARMDQKAPTVTGLLGQDSVSPSRRS